MNHQPQDIEAGSFPLQQQQAFIASGIAIAGTVGSLIEGNQAKKVAQGQLSAQQRAINDTQFQPIDLTALTTAAHNQAIQNIQQSLAAEQQFAPGVAATRQQEQSQVAARVAQGGNLPPDVVNAVTRGAAAQGGVAGLTGSNGPLTAADLGMTALQLQNQNLALGAQELAANPAPVVGLDPGALASAMVANNNAQNQFNLSKLGAQGNLANSTIQQAQSSAQQGAQAFGGLNGILSSSALSGIFGGSGSAGGAAGGNLQSNQFSAPAGSASLGGFGGNLNPALFASPTVATGSVLNAGAF